MFAGLADRVTKYEWGQEVVPGITAIETPGHTPGHTSFAGSPALLAFSSSPM
jgi:glyoxylase-like metal-dependent hydrolase (beta-lactamase superfamily II)